MEHFTTLGAAAARVVEKVRPGPSVQIGRPGVEQWPVTDRASWLARRQADVTASAAAALLGCHKYLTAYGLHALKAGLVTEDPEETPVLQRGRLLEPVAIQLIREQRPTWKVWQPGIYLRDPAARLGATPDAIAIDPERPGFGVLQIKTVEPSIFRREWRTEDGDVEPPLYIAVQALVEAHLTGASWGAVAPLRVGFGLDLDLIDVPLHPGLTDRIKTEVAAFWRGVENGQPPDPDYARDGATIAALYAPDEDVPPVDLSGDNMLAEIVAEHETISERASADKKRKAAIDAEITAKLAGATVGLLADGRAVTRKIQRRGSYVAKATEFPVIRIKGAA